MTQVVATERAMSHIKGFSLTTKIGEGTRYVMYRGRRDIDGLDVAMKVVNVDYTRMADIARLKHAYGIIQRLDSERIVKVYGVEEQPETLAIVTEYFPSAPLTSFLRERGTLGIGEFLDIAVTLVGALDDVHRMGLVHGDMRPQNILVGEGNRIKLTGFGVDSVVTREKEAIYSRHVLREVLPYTSPEQTNRMNRSVDYRTDMYSLGVVFYEMLVGRRPFESEDPLELIHAHIAATPEPPSYLRPEVPPPLSAILLKLLSKGAEDRYDSAEGLRLDLVECQLQWAASGRIEPFVLGQHDESEHLQIHQGLYGREIQIRKLVESFDDVIRGRRAILLVSGYSGIGKSSLVHEILKPLAREKGYYITGKYDQYIRDTPYSALIQAFDGLIKQLLCESEERLANWRQAILDAVGTNGQVICDFLPAVRHIIGEQPPVPALGPVDAQNRFNLYFKKFVAVFAQPAHPLAIFVDDLQWVDSASLSLIKAILASEDKRALFFCGAYRDNEVSPTHAFMVALEELEQGGIKLIDIVLEPLGLEHLNALLRDSLSVDDCEALAAVVLKKTGGNPFFVKRFLKHIDEAKMLYRDPKTGWGWDLAAIEQLDYSDNVVGLMAETIRRLPERTSDVLRLAAAIGNTIDLEVLNAVSASSPDETYARLEVAIREGLIVAAGEVHRFAHDKIQEAAYSLIPAGERAAHHYKIGRLLLGKLDPDKGQNLFDIINHLNNAGDLMKAPEERLTAARLNLKAAERAEDSSAFSAALHYLKCGIAMLPADAWRSAYELTFSYFTKKGVLESLCERHDDALATLSACLKEAKGRLHETEVRRLVMNVQILKNDLLAALDVGLAALRTFGVDLPAFPDADALARERARTFAMIGDRPVSALVDLPLLGDPEIAALQDLLQEMFTPCYQLGTRNLAITIMKMLQNTLEYGISKNSIFAFMNFGTVLCVSMDIKDIELGYAFGCAGIRLAELYPDKKSEPMLANMWAAWVQHWKEGYSTCKATLRRGMHTGVEAGQYIWAFYNTVNASTNSLLQGRHIDEILEEVREYQPLCKLDKFNAIAWMCSAIAEHCEDLGRPTEKASRVAWVDMNVIKDDARKINNTASLYFANVYDVMGGVFKGAYEEVAELWLTTDPMGDVMLPAWHGNPGFYFYGGVAFARAATNGAEEFRAARLARFHDCANRINVWAGLNPESLRHRDLLLKAEFARMERSASAGGLYDQAITAAREGGFLHDEALGNELCALHYLELGRSFLARSYMAEAHRAYGRWGAIRVMERLERDYSHVFRPDGSAHSVVRVAEGAAARDLDLGLVVKASQAISSEILLPRLLQKLMRVVLESAGARRGFMVLRENDRLVVRAEGHIDHDEITVLPSTPLETRNDLATTIVTYVARTAESVVLHEGGQSSPFAGDPHIQRAAPRSLFASPILRQGRLVGVIYLENELAAGVFTKEHTEMIGLLSSQVAISIENALLYANLEENVRLRTLEIEEANQHILALNVEQQRRQAEELVQKQALITRQMELIRLLSTPILEIWDGILTIPIVGVIDEERSAVLTQNLLSRVVATQSKFAIVDLTGVVEMDPGTAEHIVRIIGALRLLGAKSVITGIQPAVARAMISLGVDLGNFVTRSNLRDGLRTCLGLARGKSSG